MQPKGMIIRKEIEEYLWDLHAERDYLRVWTPHLAKEALYECSGHAGHYMDDMFSVKGGSSGEGFYVKPMNCPHHMQLFADNQFSYRDMPIRYFEPATVYRDEKSGQLSGLTRVRAITQDDGHLFCRVDQIKEEVSTIVDIIKTFYTTFGLMEGYWVSLSVRDPANTEKYL
jgi:threonyl-tRNA synthetase